MGSNDKSLSVSSAKPAGRCCHCGEAKELRPYGPAGAGVCFDCAMKPARKHDTEARFDGRLNMTQHSVLTADGPRPATDAEQHFAARTQHRSEATTMKGQADD